MFAIVIRTWKKESFEDRVAKNTVKFRTLEQAKWFADQLTHTTKGDDSFHNEIEICVQQRIGREMVSIPINDIIYVIEDLEETRKEIFDDQTGVTET